MHHLAAPFRAQIICLLLVAATNAQDPVESPAPASPATTPGTKIDKRVFGVLPNYRTADGSLPYKPISPSRKMTIALKDTFDWPLYFIGGAFAGLSQLSDSNHYLGQGVKGYANRFVRNYADQAVGNIMTEGILPSLLHEDPRYFRRGEGSVGHRLAYAATRILVTRTDSGGQRFNISEVAGNSFAVALSNTYYRDTRNVGDNLQKLGMQLGTDSFSNVLKEFWPDVKRRLRHR